MMPGIEGADIFIPKAKSRQRTGPEILDDDVGLPAQSQ